MAISNEHYGWQSKGNPSLVPPSISLDFPWTIGINLSSTLFFIILRGLDILKSRKTYFDVKKY